MSLQSKKANEEFERWSKEVKRGAASLAILAVLEDESSYGYEIVKKLEDKGASFLAFEQGTVYPLLRRLEEKRGLLQAAWNYDDPTKPRKYYSITSEGQEVLKLMKEKWTELSREMERILEGDAQ
ncbi:MAG: PadR family transcriptional regulator [Candidatus Thorarchaeota archaeon]